MAKITKRQYEELKEAYENNDLEFARKLEEYTGIERREFTSYDYYIGDDYVGNSDDSSLYDILRNAYVEVTEDGQT